MTNPSQEPLINEKKLESMRNSLSKTIEDFKKSVLASIGKSDQGPLKESLRADIGTEPPAQTPPLITPIIKHVALEQTDIIPAPQVEQWVEQETNAPTGPSVLQANTEQTIFRALGQHFFFVGLDNEINSNIRLFLQKLGIRTFLPQLEGVQEQAIVEQFRLHNDFGFAVVILTPDEYMFPKMQDPQNAFLVTNQKTIFELGFLVGKLGRNRVAVFYEENDKFKRPTEYFDLLYTPYDDTGLWQQKLLRQMQACGIYIHEEHIAST